MSMLFDTVWPETVETRTKVKIDRREIFFDNLYLSAFVLFSDDEPSSPAMLYLLNRQLPQNGAHRRLAGHLLVLP
jgi:hypothetical protein